MLGKNILVIVAATLSGAALVIIFFLAGLDMNTSRARASQGWKLNAIKASYAHSELKEINPEHAVLLLTYDLENNTDIDYRLTEHGTSGDVIIMSRLKSDGSLSQEDPMRLAHPVYLPAGQTVRISIEVSHPFLWPAPGDPALAEKLKDFVKQRLTNVAGFVLFDEADRCQVELPRAWNFAAPATRASD
ncbi:MAG TPA: hypothetical protein VOA41_00480 [Candidatus Dormibacteraeota bacterium]|nr:hypothetical protein [Candidatus Dormibacteraeota bacterium]